MFQLTIHKKADFEGGRKVDYLIFVLTHSPARGLTSFTFSPFFISFVSTHSPARGLTLTVSIVHPSCGFNSQPRRGADGSSRTSAVHMRRFNSQPRKGADRNVVVSIRWIFVSTHSPARGLTSSAVRSVIRVSSFNSQPRKGADPFYLHVFQI